MSIARGILERVRRGLSPRRRSIPVTRFDAGQWRRTDVGAGADRDELTLITFNIWNDAHFADQRHSAIADLMARLRPDVMAFQEVSRRSHDILLSHPWVREHCFSAAAVHRGVGDYGMVMLSRVPLREVTYTQLPSRMLRGFLRAEVTVGGVRTAVCSVHLDSGKASAELRARQLRDVFGAMRPARDAVVLGDFNMRDAENHRVAAPFTDVWPMLRPSEPGFTEDTSINVMRLDSRNKHRQVRFDRVLLKGSAWTPEGIELIGTQPISDATPRIFPSDHFGLRCRLVRSGPAWR